MRFSSLLGGVLLITLSSTALAEYVWDRNSATDKERTGYTCSAQLMVMTMGDAGKNSDELQLKATTGGMILSQLAAQETMQRTGKGITNGNMLTIRDNEIDVLTARLKLAPEETKKESHYCLAWATAVQNAIMKNRNITPNQIPVLDSNSVPKASSSQVRYVNSAFENWKKSGYIKPSAMKEALRRQLQ